MTAHRLFGLRSSTLGLFHRGSTCLRQMFVVDFTNLMFLCLDLVSVGSLSQNMFSFVDDPFKDDPFGKSDVAGQSSYSIYLK